MEYILIAAYKSPKTKKIYINAVKYILFCFLKVHDYFSLVEILQRKI